MRKEKKRRKTIEGVASSPSSSPLLAAKFER